MKIRKLHVGCKNIADLNLASDLEGKLHAKTAV